MKYYKVIIRDNQNNAYEDSYIVGANDEVEAWKYMEDNLIFKGEEVVGVAELTLKTLKNKRKPFFAEY